MTEMAKRWETWGVECGKLVMTQCLNLEYRREMQTAIWVEGVSLGDVLWKARIHIVQKGGHPTKNYLERVWVGNQEALCVPGRLVVALSNFWGGFLWPRAWSRNTPPRFRNKLEAIWSAPGQVLQPNLLLPMEHFFWNIPSSLVLSKLPLLFRQPNTFEHLQQECNHGDTCDCSPWAWQFPRIFALL